MGTKSLLDGSVLNCQGPLDARGKWYGSVADVPASAAYEE